MNIDLHMHSVYSDGELTPKELALRAKQNGMDAVSLTDHDTLAGTHEMQQACLILGLKCLSGIEISTFEDAEIHILGYGFSAAPDAPMAVESRRFAVARQQRIDMILQKLNRLGVDVSLSDIKTLSTVSVSRGHIARILVKKGYCTSVGAAMERYLAPGRAAWVDFFRVNPEEAVSVIKSCGGLAVLAHPGRIKLSSERVDALLSKLVNSGLDGIESFYATHTNATVQRFRALAEKYSLLNTNGSDFHNGSDHHSKQRNTYFLAEEKTVEALGLKKDE